MNLLNVFRMIGAVGVLSLLMAMITAIGSQSRYDDLLPEFLFMAAVIALFIGALGLFILGLTQ